MSITGQQLEDIRQARATTTATLRPTVPALEEVLYEPISRCWTTASSA